MQTFVSKVLEPLNDLRCSISRPQSRVKPSVRQKLDDLSSFRILPTAIEFTSGDSHKSGGQADVARATYRQGSGIDEQVVAVKKIRYHGDVKGSKLDNEFVHEVKLMAGLSHKNIAQLIGFIEDLENETAWIVLSWEPNGNVKEFLAKGEWEIPERVSFIKDTFESIKYLHTRQPPICYGDLKSFNILVSSEYRAIITDFGSARAICTSEDDVVGDQSRPHAQGLSTGQQASPPIHVNTADNQLTLTGPAWSLRWAAPEVINGKRPGLSSDIWAAGWICWEVMTDNVPFSELSAVDLIALTVIQGEVPSPREEGQLGQIMALCSLMTDCWAFDPKVRPSISRCCAELHWMPSTPPSGANHSGPKEPSFDLLLEMGRMGYMQDNYEKAVLLFQQALSVAMSAGTQRATAHALQGLGDCYRSQSKYAQAEESYTRAQEIYTRVGNDLDRANVLFGLSHVYIEQAKYTRAEESYARAQEIYARIGDDVGRANAMRGLGTLYRVQSKHTEAEESFTRAHEIYARIGEEMGRAGALDDLGEILRAQSKYPEAEELFSRAHEIHARIGNDSGRAGALHGLGNIYRLQSKYTEAEDSYTRAHEIYTRIGYDLGRANALRGMGHLRREQGRNAEAVAHYARARKLYTQLGRAGNARSCVKWAGRCGSD